MADSASPLVGLILAGGQSRRMGCDKGSLIVGGIPQAERAFRALSGHCEAVYVSIRQQQASLEPYRRLPSIADDAESEGPAAGVIAAWSQLPGVALLVLAVDMPLVDEDLLAILIQNRDASRCATVFRNEQGILEPLCAIWEPRAFRLIRENSGRGRSVSLRSLLEKMDVQVVVPPDPRRLISINAPRLPQ